MPGIGGSTSFTVAMKSTIDEIDVDEGTPDYSGAKAKFAALGIQGAADEIRTVEPYWELARAYFGTDGIRGEANRHPMTAEVALRVGMAAGKVFMSRDERRHLVVIGKDTRLSGYMI